LQRSIASTSREHDEEQYRKIAIAGFSVWQINGLDRTNDNDSVSFVNLLIASIGRGKAIDDGLNNY
jgi:hypothetical protein